MEIFKITDLTEMLMKTSIKYCLTHSLQWLQSTHGCACVHVYTHTYAHTHTEEVASVEYTEMLLLWGLWCWQECIMSVAALEIQYDNFLKNEKWNFHIAQQSHFVLPPTEVRSIQELLGPNRRSLYTYVYYNSLSTNGNGPSPQYRNGLVKHII